MIKLTSTPEPACPIHPPLDAGWGASTVETWADFNVVTRGVLHETGYACAFTAQQGAIRSGVDPDTLLQGVLPDYGVGPEAEAAAGESMALPVYPELAEEHQRYIVKLIREFYQ